VIRPDFEQIIERSKCSINVVFGEERINWFVEAVESAGVDVSMDGRGRWIVLLR
jgi:hypothetical protein